MLYLSHITFPDPDAEFDFRLSIRRTCYDSFYPFGVLSRRALRRIDFEPITILCGGNGSGKTTALNIIAEKLRLRRTAPFNQSNFLKDYLDLCHYALEAPVPEPSRIITSDDVFDYMLNIRALNQGLDNRREQLFQEYLDEKYADFQLRSISDYAHLKRINAARRKTQSKFVRGELMDTVREYSNGESAFRYFTDQIEGDALYLLDEPENSLSPARQLELKQYLEDSARYADCQIVLSTHSPFLLALTGAKIYDLDADPVDLKPWTDLPTVKIHREFFKQHEPEFEE